MTIGLGHYLVVAAILFTLGIFGIFLNRKNVIVILMSIELILLAVNINLVAFSSLPRRYRRPGLRAVRADGRGGRSRDRARHPGRLLPQPRLDRGRRHQSDEGLSADVCRPSSFFPLLGISASPGIFGAPASARAPSPNSSPRACSFVCRRRCPGSLRPRSLSGTAPASVSRCSAPLDHLRRPQGRLGAADRHADRRDAGRGDHACRRSSTSIRSATWPRIPTGRASSPICRSSPSPC